MELVDVKGKKLEDYANISIIDGKYITHYVLNKPNFSEKESILAEQIISVLTRKATYGEITRKLGGELSPEFVLLFRDKIVKNIETLNLYDTIPNKAVEAEIKENLLQLIKTHATFVKNPVAFVNYVYDNSLGYGLLGELIRDEMLEEIMVNGYNHFVYVFHRKYGMCKTNIYTKEDGFLDVLINKISASVGKKISVHMPLIDAHLPDGSRANITSQYVTPFGPTITIRKFSKIPYSVIDLVKSKTLSAEVAAFLWVMIDGFNISPMNIIIAGGSGTGKTTLLNSLVTFIRARERLISLEDAIELHFHNRENWIQMESKPATKEVEEVTMDDLLKNALRMRPDRIIVGEVRGKEAQTLFVAMDTGHDGILGTLHANNARETILRLKAAPMNVPESLLPLLNLIVVMEKRNLPKHGIIRRVSHIAEISRMEDQVLLANLFEWDVTKDVIVRTPTPSKIIETLAQRAGLTKKQLMDEMYVRQRVIEWLVQHNIRSIEDFDAVVQEYYTNPAEVLEMISK